MPDIGTVIDAWSVKQLALAITSPVVQAIKVVYNLPPDRAQALTDVPCWLNGWSLNQIEWGLDVTGGPRHEFYTIHSQLFVDDASINQAAKIATAFLAQLLVAVKADYTLGGNVQQIDVRGGTPTLALLEWAGQSYPGLDLFIDVEIRN